MLTFNMYRTLVVVSIFLLIQPSYQWVKSHEVDEYFYKKPMVLPSSERAYHSVAIEYNTVIEGGARVAQFAYIYVAIVDSQFTFGGHNVKTPSGAFPQNNARCALILNSNRMDLCDDDYFLLHSDMIKLEKVLYNKEHQLEKLCTDIVKKRKPGIKYSDKENFVMKYGNRVLMMYLKNSHSEKCIGTYDLHEDSFRCVQYDPATQSFKNVKIDGFLYDQTTGDWTRTANSVEVFCRVPYTFN